MNLKRFDYQQSCGVDEDVPLAPRTPAELSDSVPHLVSLLACTPLAMGAIWIVYEFAAGPAEKLGAL